MRLFVMALAVGVFMLPGCDNKVSRVPADKNVADGDTTADMDIIDVLDNLVIDDIVSDDIIVDDYEPVDEDTAGGSDDAATDEDMAGEPDDTAADINEVDDRDLVDTAVDEDMADVSDDAAADMDEAEDMDLVDTTVDEDIAPDEPVDDFVPVDEDMTDVSDDTAADMDEAEDMDLVDTTADEDIAPDEPADDYEPVDDFVPVDDYVSVDDYVPVDDSPLPDLDVVPDACQINTDCPFGSRCDTAVSPHACIAAGTCSSDIDCQSYQTCQVVDNWKECKFDLSQTCASDADCQPGEVCETVLITYKVCRSMNKCADDTECAANEVCDWTGTYYECVAVCTTDTDCDFGYRCTTATPHNLCEYANECTSDADCPAFNACQASGNWLVCNFSTGGGFCTSDANCAASEYCDLSLGFFGTCKSRDQCQIDKDCGDGMVCTDNGTYNECVPANPKQCYFDFQCPADWVCAENVCTPQYAGICPEIEGLWNVLVSTSLLFTNGSAYEFIPAGGCNGSIKQEGGTLSAGTFAQTSSFNYDLKMLLLFNCTAQITLNTVMQVTCDSGTATLIRN